MTALSAFRRPLAVAATVLALAGCSVGATTRAPAPAAATASGCDKAYAATVEYVVDGDTLDVALDLGLHVHLDTRLRLAHVDAPEVSTAAGKESRDWLRQLLPAGSAVLVATSKTDKYGRALADVQLPDGRDLATVELAEGKAVPYEGGARG